MHNGHFQIKLWVTLIWKILSVRLNERYHVSFLLQIFFSVMLTLIINDSGKAKVQSQTKLSCLSEEL